MEEREPEPAPEPHVPEELDGEVVFACDAAECRGRFVEGEQRVWSFRSGGRLMHVRRSSDDRWELESFVDGEPYLRADARPLEPWAQGERPPIPAGLWLEPPSLCHGAFETVRSRGHCVDGRLDGRLDFDYADAPDQEWFITYRQGQMHGPFADRDSIRRRTEGTFFEGRVHGERRLFSTEGWLVEVAHYEHGRMHGEQTTFHPNGRPATRTSYEHHVEHGAYRAWSDDGRVVLQGQHHRGARTGRWRMYHPNGRVRSEGHYFDERLAARCGRGRRLIGVTAGCEEIPRGQPCPAEQEALRACAIDGRPTGSWRFYAPSGRLLRRFSMGEWGEDRVSLQVPPRIVEGPRATAGQSLASALRSCLTSFGDDPLTWWNGRVRVRLSREDGVTSVSAQPDVLGDLGACVMRYGVARAEEPTEATFVVEYSGPR